MTKYTEIIQTIQKHQKFIMSSHQNPDGDALGSSLGLAHHLLNLGKTVTILNSDPSPPNYRFLDPNQLVQTYVEKHHQPLIDQAEVIIILDVSDGWSRLGRVGKALSKSKALSICIDHHPNTTPFTTFSHIDTEPIATAILVFELIQAMQGDKTATLPITPIMAQALYTAIYTDSDGFRFPKTTPRTHRIAAQLLEIGLDPAQIYARVYEQNSLNQIQLKGYIWQNIQLAYEGQVAYIGLNEKILKQFELSPFEVHGLSGLGQEIERVRMSILALQLPRQRVKLSLRSDGSIPVNQIAAHFGGGGHLPAAGATTEGDLDKIMAQVLEKTGELIMNY